MTNRYFLAQEANRCFYVADSFNNNRPAKSGFGGSAIFQTAEDAAWYSEQLNLLRTPLEIAEGR